MEYQLWYDSTVVGLVELTGPDPAAGWLETLPGYATIEKTVRSAGDAWTALWRTRSYQFARLHPRGQLAVEEADKIVRALSLRTVAGTPVAVESLSLWDSSASGERPFLLAYRGAQPAGVTADVVHPLKRGSEGQRPAG